MTQLWEWLPALVLLGVGVVLAWRDPRRMPPALAFTALLFWLGGRGLLALMQLADRLDEEMGPVWVLIGFVAASVLAILVLGVFLIWNAVEVTRREGRRLAAVVTGAVGAGLLAYVAVACVAVAVDDAGMVVWLMFVGLPLGYVSFVFLSFLLYSLVYGWLTRRFGKPVEAVVILGSGLLGGDRVPPLLAARIDLGYRLYEESRAAGLETVLVPSGGQGSDEKIAEATAMALYLHDRGVDPAHVLREDRSTDTRENLELSSAVLERAGVQGDVAVATNNFHAFRAATLMRSVGMEGYSIGAPTAHYYWPSATVREFLAVLRDNLVINVVALGVLCVPFIVFVTTAVARLLGS